MAAATATTTRNGAPQQDRDRGHTERCGAYVKHKLTAGREAQRRDQRREQRHGQQQDRSLDSAVL